MSDKKPEILSPAGSSESLIAAVRSGADAVYLGSKNFSARRNAENFCAAELKDAVGYCHERGIKVYLTLNTMIKSKELSSAFETAEEAYASGADGIIISDLGLADILRREIPDFPLHGSTQLSVHSPAALSILKEKGFSRIVLAREMSREQISEFCEEAKKQKIETEVFVHGALCMSLSGQCLLSSMIGQRSGNRGLCAGPCRLPFCANGSDKNRYDLSLKDLSLINHIDELKAIGVDSLKIEGRMKRPEYVAAATAVCRLRADGKEDKALEKNLMKIFSRSGFTDGYFISNTGKEMFGTRTKDDVISSAEAIKQIHELYRKERNSVPLKMDFTAISGKPVRLTVTDGGNTVTEYGAVPEIAQNKPTLAEDIKSSLSKLGSTPYFLKEINIKSDDNIFIVGKEINLLRRTAAERLSLIRKESGKKVINSVYEYDKKEVKIDNNEKCFILKLPDLKHVPSNLSNVKGIIFPLGTAAPKLQNGIKLIAEIPRLIKDESTVLKKLILMKRDGFSACYCGELSAISLSLKAGLEPIGGTSLNICNYESVNAFLKAGVKTQFISAEIQADEIPLLKNKNIGCFAFGRLPLMITANCPVKNSADCSECRKNGNLKDRMGIEFPVACKNGYCEILNSKPIYLADRKNKLNVKYLLLWFEKESKEEIEEIIKKYEIGAPPDFDYTRGLYYRNLL